MHYDKFLGFVAAATCGIENLARVHIERESSLQRVCFLLKVRPEYLAEYKQRHTQVWPEMRAALSEVGWHNYSLFLHSNGMLVGYLETPDFQKAITAMKNHPVNERWQREMAVFFESSSGEGADDQMIPLEEIFHLD